MFEPDHIGTRQIPSCILALCSEHVGAWDRLTPEADDLFAPCARLHSLQASIGGDVWVQPCATTCLADVTAKGMSQPGIFIEFPCFW
jgi:hypothetical protein